MMRRLPSIIAVLLILCIVGISGVASAQSVLHESHHHSHHQAATHGSTFCSWMCAAGQVGDGATVPPLLRLIPLESLEIVSFGQTGAILSREFATRGPPPISI